MIICKRCGETIPAKYQSCPHCGNDPRKEPVELSDAEKAAMADKF